MCGLADGNLTTPRPRNLYAMDHVPDLLQRLPLDLSLLRLAVYSHRQNHICHESTQSATTAGPTTTIMSFFP